MRVVRLLGSPVLDGSESGAATAAVAAPSFVTRGYAMLDAFPAILPTEMIWRGQGQHRSSCSSVSCVAGQLLRLVLCDDIEEKIGAGGSLDLCHAYVDRRDKPPARFAETCDPGTKSAEPLDARGGDVPWNAAARRR